MATYSFTLRGDQIGSFTSYSGNGNGTSRIVTVNNVTAFGSPSEIFTVVVTQAATDATQFQNGQFITIYNSLGQIVMPQASVQNDLEQGYGTGDEHMIIGGANVLIDLAGLAPGPSQVQYGLPDETATSFMGDNDGELDFADVRTSFPCFADGTLIATPHGETRVEDLTLGDQVLTRDNGPMPIAHIASRTLKFTAAKDAQKPILLPRNSLGPQTPQTNLRLSPQHRVLIQTDQSQQALIPAKALITRPGIRVMHGLRQITYYSITLHSHQIIRANGVACETFYPGEYMMRNLPDDLSAELYRRWPMLHFGAEIGYGPPARPMLTLRQARDLLRQSPSAYPANIFKPCVTSDRTANRKPGSSPAFSAAMISL